MQFTIQGIARHRMQTDGKGITTLVALAGCPLSCAYCINKELLQDEKRLERVTPEVYLRYTGRENKQVIHNLREICERLPQENYVVKLPLIPGYTREAEVEDSRRQLQEMGIPEENIKVFTYITP